MTASIVMNMCSTVDTTVMNNAAKSTIVRKGLHEGRKGLLLSHQRK
jgi:hypothetical protein